VWSGSATLVLCVVGLTGVQSLWPRLRWFWRWHWAHWLASTRARPAGSVNPQDNRPFGLAGDCSSVCHNLSPAGLFRVLLNSRARQPVLELKLTKLVRHTGSPH
jgi:hypothetical protein